MISRCGVRCAGVQTCTKCLPRTHGAVGETPAVLSISVCLEGRKSWNLRTKYHGVAFPPVQHKFWHLKKQAYLSRHSVLSCKLLSVWLILFESTEPSSRRSSLWEDFERNREIGGTLSNHRLRTSTFTCVWSNSLNPNNEQNDFVSRSTLFNKTLPRVTSALWVWDGGWVHASVQIALGIS